MQQSLEPLLSKRECIQYIKKEILAQVTPCLQDSVMSLAVRDSKATNSKYISLCYPQRDDNPDPFRLPYVVRISDHENTFRFSAKQPHCQIRICAILPMQQKVRFDRLEQEHSTVSAQLHKEVSSKQRECLVQRLKDICEGIALLSETFIYSYQGNLQEAIQEMINIAKANPKS